MSNKISLSTKNLSVEVDQQKLIHNVDIDLHEREILALIGPNGAGKTTLLKSIAGLIEYTGDIFIDDKPLHQLSSTERAQQIAYMPQQSRLMSPVPVFDVIAQGRFIHRHPLKNLSSDDKYYIDCAIEKTNLHNLIRRNFTSLSLGEQRRVLIARALASEAKILLLDEPDAFLDVGHAIRLMMLLQSLAQESFSIFISIHSLDLLDRFTNRCVLLQKGHVLINGQSHEILKSPQFTKSYGAFAKAETAYGFFIDEKPSL